MNKVFHRRTVGVGIVSPEYCPFFCVATKCECSCVLPLYMEPSVVFGMKYDLPSPGS